jgi:hypothetical protein
LPTNIPKFRYRRQRTRDCVARLLCPKRDPVPPSIATYDRIDELARPTLSELPCALCGGVGLPKLPDTDMRICIVCRDALKDIPRGERGALLHNHEDYMWYRMPFFEQYLVSDNRMHPDTNVVDKTA